MSDPQCWASREATTLKVHLSNPHCLGPWHVAMLLPLYHVAKYVINYDFFFLIRSLPRRQQKRPSTMMSKGMPGRDRSTQTDGHLIRVRNDFGKMWELNAIQTTGEVSTALLSSRSSFSLQHLLCTFIRCFILPVSSCDITDEYW